MNVINNSRVGTYILAQQSTGYLKVGSTTNLENRIKMLQTGSPMKLYPLLWIPNIDMEQHLKKLFKPWLVLNEWYRSSEEIDDFIREYTHKRPEKNQRQKVIKEPNNPEITDYSVFFHLFEGERQQENQSSNEKSTIIEAAEPFLSIRHKKLLGELLLKLDVPVKELGYTDVLDLPVSMTTIRNDLWTLESVGLADLWTKGRGRKMVHMVSLNEDIDKKELYDFVKSAIGE